MVQDRGGVAEVVVGPEALDSEEVGVILNGNAALEGGVEVDDEIGREFGEVGEGLVTDTPAVALGLAEQDGWFVGMVTDACYVERHWGESWAPTTRCRALATGRSPLISRDCRQLGLREVPVRCQWSHGSRALGGQ